MEYSRSLSRLQRLCSKAEYCRADIYRKALKDLDGDAAEASRLVEELIRDRYVDDARYASAFAREKARKKGLSAPILQALTCSQSVSSLAITVMNSSECSTPHTKKRPHEQYGRFLAVYCI